FGTLQLALTQAFGTVVKLRLTACLYRSTMSPAHVAEAATELKTCMERIATTGFNLRVPSLIQEYLVKHVYHSGFLCLLGSSYLPTTPSTRVLVNTDPYCLFLPSKEAIAFHRDLAMTFCTEILLP